MCFEHPKNEKNVSANRKNTPEANKKKKQKKNKEDNYKETTYRNNSYKNRNNKNKTNVYILGNSMVKKLNRYPLTRKIKHKNLKRCSFSGVKISCLMDHVKPTLQDINLDHIIVHAGTNDLKTENTISQIAKATSLKNDDNTELCLVLF